MRTTLKFVFIMRHYTIFSQILHVQGGFISHKNIQHPEQYTLIVSAYAHKHWLNHYISVREQHCIIEECLQGFRHILSTAELYPLYPGVTGVAHKFLRIINFLAYLRHAKDIPTVLYRDLDLTWETLLPLLFDPIPAVALCMIDILSSERHTEDIPSVPSCDLNGIWETLLTALCNPIPAVSKIYATCGVRHHSDGFNISSSLGIVFQCLWGEYSARPKLQTAQRLNTFLDGQPSMRIRCGAAEISIRLLMYRTAEMKAWLSKPQRIAERLHYDYLRADTHWSFASRWCICLAQAPPTTKLLTMLRGLIENTLIVQGNEIYHQLLKQWLIAMPANLEMQAKRIYTAFEAARTISAPVKWMRCNSWVEISFSE
ncbi:hypothetical protein MVEN_01128600 [Mycena venus]|uniref:Uncharacterized protein n=1 Tax=Mycena venus TaxID=2733690 RepID=A0A8H6Y9N8_9AGAR|nr:hypothetical protein MVEN_01128600 [Mycena venus]